MQHLRMTHLLKTLFSKKLQNNNYKFVELW